MRGAGEKRSLVGARWYYEESLLERRTLKVYSMKVDFSCVGGIEYCVKLSLSICIHSEG